MDASISPPHSAVNVKSRRRSSGFVVALAASILLLSCGGDGDSGGGRGRPGELKELSGDEYEKLVEVGEFPSTGVEPGTEIGVGTEVRADGLTLEWGGTLSGTGDKESFDVVPWEDQVDVVFDWPKGDVDFWVKVYGEDGEVAGDFDLDNGEIIQLSSREEFTLEIYSREGGGAWRATCEY